MRPADAALPTGARRLSFRPLPRTFYDRETDLVARDLLGAVLECTRRGVRTRGIITETEAYLGEHDPACHAAVGRTKRTAGLYGPPGTAYVYFIYGMYWCVNAVTRAEGLPSAVLIRGVHPLDGIAAMQRRRPSARSVSALADGPGKLCLAMAIDGPTHHGVDLVTSTSLRILRGAPVDDARVQVTPRIGISKAKDWPLRWIVRGDREIAGSRDRGEK